MKKPFVLIAGVMRTGTTLLQEMFTDAPFSYILHEPWLSAGQFYNKEHLQDTLKEMDVPLSRLFSEDPMQTVYDLSIPEFFEKLNGYIAQLGVKEIRLKTVSQYLKWFPDAKVVLTGRNPKDIFLSCHYKLMRGDTSWRPKYLPFSPEALFAEINEDWRKQERLWQEHGSNCLLVRYEDLVEDPEGKWAKIASFIESSLEAPGKVGEFHKKIERGKYETGLHKGSVTRLVKDRWKTEGNLKVLERAVMFASLMGQTGYLDFWGYDL